MKLFKCIGSVMLAMGLLSPAGAAAQEGPTIYGNVAASDGSTPTGIYKFVAGPDIALEPIKVDDGLVGSRGAFYADGRYEVVNMMTHTTWDATTWEVLHECRLGWPAMMEMAAMAVTYDATTGNTYGCYLTTTQTYRFATADYTDNSVTPIKDLGADVWANSMFIGDGGVLYAIMNNGDLVTVDKTTGDTSVIGNIDFETTGYQGAVYDPSSGKAYWTAVTGGTSGLYEIDLSDASVTLVSEFPAGEQLTGLWIKPGNTPGPGPDPQGETFIYGNVAASDGGTATGIYKFAPGADIALEAVKVDAGLVGSRGAFYADGRYEVVNMMKHTTWDATSWEVLHECQLGWPAMMEMAAMAVTYDPTTGNTYGCYLTTTQSYRFATADYTTNTVTEIKDLGADVWANCMFIGKDGVLYAIMNNGDLVTVNKTNGETSVIGNIDFETTGYQGAVYDLSTGKAYWTAVTGGTSGLYEIDLTDASVTLVSEFPAGEQLTGLWIESGNTPAPGPDPEVETFIYGDVAASDNSVTATGVYSFKPGADIALEPVKTDANLVGSRGAFYADGRYEVVNMMKHTTWDATSWEVLHECQLGWPAMMEMAAMAVTYDPTTGNTYGCYLTTTQSYRFATADYTTNTVTEIKDLGADVWANCMFIGKDGVLYAIMNNGDLVTVNKTTGETSLIGNIDFETTGYQGAVYDPSTGKAYWTAVTGGTSGLYEIDLTDASVTLVSEFPNGEQLTGLWLVQKSNGNPGKEDGVPAPAANVVLNFPEGAMTGTVTFDAPANAVDGNALTKELTYAVRLGENVVAEGTAEPGKTVTSPEITVATVGNAVFSVIVSNAAGTSSPAYKNGFIGFDTPAAPSDVVLKNDGNKMTLTWKAPAAGLNGGWFDAAGLTYDVVRYPGAVKVADKITSLNFEETLENVSIANYYYGVTAYNGPSASDETKSEGVKLGSYVIPPYSEDFRRTDALDYYTVIDANGDGHTWGLNSWSPIAEYFAPSQGIDADDWLVTPPVNMNRNDIYRVRFKATGIESDLYRADIALFTGDEPTAEALTEAVVEKTFVTDSRVLDAIVTVDADGLRHFGFHTTTPALGGWINLTDFTIEAIGSLDGPAVVDNFSVIAGAKGALNAEISFNAPTKDGKGNSLAAIEKIELRRDGEVINTWNNPAVGAALKFTDNVAQDGTYRYEAVAYSDKGAGRPEMCSAFVGVDTPAPAENVQLTVSDDGKATITWQPATVGANGGYVDMDAVRFTLQRSDGEIVARGISGTQFTDTPVKYDDQYELAYAVVAINDKGNSQVAVSNSILFGDNYRLPFSESFKGAATTYFWGLRNSQNGSFGLVDQFSMDNDGGSVLFMGDGEGAEAEIYTGRIDMTDAPYANLDFYAPLNSGEASLAISVITPDGVYHELDNLLFNGQGEFNPVSVAVNGYDKYPYVQISLKAASDTPGTMMFIDAILLDKISGLQNVIGNEAQVTVKDKTIFIEGAANVPVAVYTPSGLTVTELVGTGHDAVEVTAAIYIVRVGDCSYKVSVR